MNLLRILTWLLVIWTFWFMIRNYLTKDTPKKPAKKPALPQKMVKCHLCSIHTPESEALLHESHWFCTRAHVQAYITHKTSPDK